MDNFDYIQCEEVYSECVEMTEELLAEIYGKMAEAIIESAFVD